MVSTQCGFKLGLLMYKLSLSMLQNFAVWAVLHTHVMCREARGPHRYVEDAHGSR